MPQLWPWCLEQDNRHGRQGTGHQPVPTALTGGTSAGLLICWGASHAWLWPPHSQALPRTDTPHCALVVALPPVSLQYPAQPPGTPDLVLLTAHQLHPPVMQLAVHVACHPICTNCRSPYQAPQLSLAASCHWHRHQKLHGPLGLYLWSPNSPAHRWQRASCTDLHPWSPEQHKRHLLYTQRPGLSLSVKCGEPGMHVWAVHQLLITGQRSTMIMALEQECHCALETCQCCNPSSWLQTSVIYCAE